jgi:ubiquinone/menaquinone biosynthesis C-methylase UbiE
METDYFERLYQLEEDHWWHSTRRRLVLDQLERTYSDRSDLRLLDGGCGTGRMLSELNRSGTAVGIDLSDEALRFCRERRLDHTVKGSLLQMPFPDATFDVLTALDVLEHVGDDVGALRECQRVLKPGGRMFIFVPAHRWLWSLQDEISHHFRRYTARTLRQAVGAAGYEIERLTYVSFFLLPIIVVGRLWLRILLRFRDVKDENQLHPGWSNGLLGSIFRSEIPLIRRVDLPIGASLFCVARATHAHRIGNAAPAVGYPDARPRAEHVNPDSRAARSR